MDEPNLFDTRDEYAKRDPNTVARRASLNPVVFGVVFGPGQLLRVINLVLH